MIISALHTTVIVSCFICMYLSVLHDDNRGEFSAVRGFFFYFIVVKRKVENKTGGRKVASFKF